MIRRLLGEIQLRHCGGDGSRSCSHCRKTILTGCTRGLDLCTSISTCSSQSYMLNSSIISPFAASSSKMRCSSSAVMASILAAYSCSSSGGGLSARNTFLSIELSCSKYSWWIRIVISLSKRNTWSCGGACSDALLLFSLASSSSSSSFSSSPSASSSRLPKMSCVCMNRVLERSSSSRYAGRERCLRYTSRMSSMQLAMTSYRDSVKAPA